MLKSKIKQFGFVLCLIFTMLASPAAACACTAMHDGHQAGEQQQFFSDDYAEHCSPQMSDEKDRRQTNQAASTNKSGENKAASSNCSCLSDGSHRTVAIEKKHYQTTEFYPVILTAHFDLPGVCQIKSIHFFTQNVAYPARSDISDKPARAPPVL